MPTISAGLPLLLRSLRAAMAQKGKPQERLDKIVALIASNMVAEVCSIYALREDQALELYANKGLNRQALHKTVLRVGEGLVGLIAAELQPLNLEDAPAHDNFLYRPETEEEKYRSFLGVPILRAGRLLGVLVVQNAARRAYAEDEVEVLQTSAMIIAEMLAAHEFAGLATSGALLDNRRSHHLKGLALCEGIGLGQAVLHEPRIIVTNLIANDINQELQRLDKALVSLRLSLDDMLESNDIANQGEHREVLEAYRMFAYDRGWARRIEEAIRSGLTAEAAVERVQNQTRARMKGGLKNSYLLSSLHDFEDLANRLLRVLMGKPQMELAQNLPENAIILARNMGAAELLDYKRASLRGLVLEEGAPSSHVSIVARALELPSVGNVGDIVALAENGDDIIVDGQAGEVYLRPSEGVIRSYSDKVRLRAKRMAYYHANRELPGVSKDGVKVELYMNAGLLLDLPHLQESGAAGIGLFRTELQFMVASSFPKMAAQKALYEEVFAKAAGKPVTFRSLDVGGDKILPYLRMRREENPAMGWRAIRLGLDRPGLMRGQIRALLLAAGGRELRIMFPMITQVEEFYAAKAAVKREVEHVRRHYRTGPSALRLGAMLEVPSLLFQLEGLLDAADFISVGSNDLLQFLMASDRGSPQVANRFDPLCHASLKALKVIVEAAQTAGKPLSVCGDMAGRPLEAMALIGLGYRQISMAPAQIGPVKEMLRLLPIKKLSQALQGWLQAAPPQSSLRPLLENFAKEHQIPH